MKIVSTIYKAYLFVRAIFSSERSRSEVKFTIIKHLEKTSESTTEEIWNLFPNHFNESLPKPWVSLATIISVLLEMERRGYIVSKEKTSEGIRIWALKSSLNEHVGE